jgi:hypothetical protein
MKPECIPEIKGKAAKEFESRIKLGPSVEQKKFLQEACAAYKKIEIK